MAIDSGRVDVGELVAAIRAERKLSPAELARRADVDVKTVRNLENGSRWPQDVTRAKLEKVLGLSPGSIRGLLEDAEARVRAWESLQHGDLSTWPQLSDGEVNAQQSESSAVSAGMQPSRSSGAERSVTAVNLSDAAEYVGTIADFLSRVDSAATDMDSDTRTLLTRAQVRSVAFLYTLVAGADDVDVAVLEAASAAQRLGGDALFRDGVKTALNAIAQLRLTNTVQLKGRESVNEGPPRDRDAIDVALPSGRGHVYLQFLSDDESVIKLHDTPPDP